MSTDSSLENRLVEVFTQIAKDIKGHGSSSSSGGTGGSSQSTNLEFNDVKKF